MMKAGHVRCGVAALAVAAGGIAAAYEIGGHHFTLAAIYSAGKTSWTSNHREKVLELFCAELPDLAMELDAITQRVHVLQARGEWRWGLFGQCTGPKSHHMFATQYYLHSLTGDGPSATRSSADERIRCAAKKIVDDIDGAYKKSTDETERATLSCARGFAAHLLGDSFAHSQLHSPGHRYPPGLGHWADNHDPDYMLSRDITGSTNGHWEHWIKRATEILAAGSQPPAAFGESAKAVLATQQSTPSRDFGEQALMDKLVPMVPSSWRNYEPPLEQWRPPDLRNIVLTERCDDQLTKGLKNYAGVQPSCAAVWDYYLKAAIAAFAVNHMDPVADSGYGSCGATDDTLKDGG